MTDEQAPSRRSFLEKTIGGAVTLIGAILAIRHDRREQEKHEWARADRQQGQVIEIGTAQETDTAMPVIAVRAEMTAPLPTMRATLTVTDPTIPT